MTSGCYAEPGGRLPRHLLTQATHKPNDHHEGSQDRPASDDRSCWVEWLRPIDYRYRGRDFGCHHFWWDRLAESGQPSLRPRLHPCLRDKGHAASVSRRRRCLCPISDTTPLLVGHHIGNDVVNLLPTTQSSVVVQKLTLLRVVDRTAVFGEKQPLDDALADLDIQTPPGPPVRTQPLFRIQDSAYRLAVVGDDPFAAFAKLNGSRTRKKGKKDEQGQGETNHGSGESSKRHATGTVAGAPFLRKTPAQWGVKPSQTPTRTPRSLCKIFHQQPRLGFPDAPDGCLGVFGPS